MSPQCVLSQFVDKFPVLSEIFPHCFPDILCDISAWGKSISGPPTLPLLLCYTYQYPASSFLSLAISVLHGFTFLSVHITTQFVFSFTGQRSCIRISISFCGYLHSILPFPFPSISVPYGFTFFSVDISTDIFPSILSPGKGSISFLKRAQPHFSFFWVIGSHVRVIGSLSYLWILWNTLSPPTFPSMRHLWRQSLAFLPCEYDEPILLSPVSKEKYPTLDRTSHSFLSIIPY